MTSQVLQRQSGEARLSIVDDEGMSEPRQDLGLDRFHTRAPWHTSLGRSLDGPNRQSQKGLDVCYCLWGCHPDPCLGPIPGLSRSHPGSEGVPSRFAMCFVLQRFGPIQVPRWGPSRPVLVPSWSRAFLPGSGLDRPKQTSWPLPTIANRKRSVNAVYRGVLGSE